ncbi:MEDS domain-containing protein [Kutzneria sp. CA-103260]|uniref:MEDS domain-containing protein n=1 Tax=Kutzneria sp. CA-103260 TaxID=2802641 RepID=UPI001BA90E7E|nr:MEDS domain-containing protein [Kutzneria sp. CA-103260]QUQ67553.1 histidine kinase-like ATPase [Kutzneria sp. CA-103260]
MASGLRHQGCLYGSDAEFLAMAVPFVRDGLARGEPVLVATTSANLELLHEAMGPEADGVDYAEAAYFGRRPPQRATAIHEYWNRHHEAVRVIAEPMWTGRSRREIEAWQRMEAGLNVVLADADIRLICPYDTRIVAPGIAEDACRTHPELVVGAAAGPSPQFMAPADFVRTHRTAGALDVAADVFHFDGDLAAVRRYVLDRATPLLRSEDDVATFGIAVGESITYLLGHGVTCVSVWVRAAAGRVVCTLHSDQSLALYPFVGFRHGDALWLTNQICEWLDVSSDAGGCTVELAVPGHRAAEAFGV